MTAVAVQQQHGAHRQQPRQSPHSANMSTSDQSRPQSYSAGPSHMRQELPIQNGTSGPMNPRPAVSNDPVQVNGNRNLQPDLDGRRTSTASGLTVDNGEGPSRRRSSLQSRPTTAPADSEQEESDRDNIKRRPKPLLRSKSDFGLRGEDPESEEDDWDEWGARHGFEDHYASEEYVSQLANVSRSSLGNFYKLSRQWVCRLRHWRSSSAKEPLQIYC